VYDGPIIDAHTHPMLSPDGQMVGQPHPPQAYRELVSESGIVRAAALTIAPAGDLAGTRERNDAVLELAHGSSGFFFPVCSVHPADGTAALAELDRVAEAGCSWLKLHPNTQNFDVADPAVTGVVARAAERALPVLFDAWAPWDANQPGKFMQLAMAVPEARLILAHAHGASFPQLLIYDAVARYPWWPRQVWIDISVAAAMFANGPFAEQFTWVLRRVGTDRIVFGSDYPLDDPLQAIRAVGELGLSEPELAAILHDNAAALLGN
jgi:predicted TIM-barrel fold metal-dependent hydrolase